MLLFISSTMLAQTKRLKRPNSAVGIFKVDDFVSRSFNIYDRVYQYDGYAKQGKALEDDDYEAMIDVVDEVSNLTAVAPDVLSSLEGQSVLKKGKATLQINRAKKALAYSLKMAKKLIAGQDGAQTDKEDSDTNTASTSEDSSETEEGEKTDDEELSQEEESSNVSDDLEIYSKYDFVPGDKILLYDDFSLDNLGDFPSKWNTNGTGELVTIDNEKWFKLAGKSTYIPDLPSDLPEDYTVEFDMLTVVDKKTSSQAKLEIWLEDNNMFDTPKNMARVEMPLCLFISIGFIVENKVDGKRVIRNSVEKDIREILLQKNHISIAVNGKRFRMWVNENKVVDVPRLLPDNITSFKLHPRDVRDGIDKVFISNVKIAQGGLDLRNQLLENGKFSTTGILFNSGSDKIKPESYGVLKQIADALQQDTSLNLNIIGHTDADGADEVNLSLSKKRSEAVKNALITVYNISGNRLQTDGKGESVAVGDNNTVEGKAQNRRVEFVKM
tara:strand:- start:12476 stop:13969 length:1494 start_codon:yes stop_codon:yes gene_type:complete